MTTDEYRKMCYDAPLDDKYIVKLPNGFQLMLLWFPEKISRNKEPNLVLFHEEKWIIKETIVSEEFAASWVEAITGGK